MPCNFHLRALAAKVKDGRPRRRRNADGVQHDRDLRRHHDGHPGMRASLVSREVIADSIELVGRGHQFDAWSRSVGCDKTIPGDRDGARAPRRPRGDALRRLDPARPLQGPRRHDPGGLRGRRRACRRQDQRRRAGRDRGRRLPRRRRLRRPVHRQHDGDGVRGARASRRSARAMVPAVDRAQGERRACRRASS